MTQLEKEMLEALKAISDNVGRTIIRGNEHGAVLWEYIEQARAAIAKATGQ